MVTKGGKDWVARRYGMSSSQAYTYDLDNFDFSNTKLVVLFTSNSAGCPNSDLQDPNKSIGKYIHDRGARCVLAWRESQMSSDTVWLHEFTRWLDKGMTIQQAANRAMDRIDVSSKNIRQLVIYGDALMTLKHSQLYTSMPADYSEPFEKDLSRMSYKANQNDLSAIADIMVKEVPGFNPADYKAEVYLKGLDGSVLSAGPGDYCVQYRLRKGDFVSTQGYTISFLNKTAYLILGAPVVSTPENKIATPRFDPTVIQYAEAVADARLQGKGSAKPIVTYRDAEPYYDAEKDTYSVKVTTDYRYPDDLDFSDDRVDIYYHPVAARTGLDVKPSPMKTYGPETAALGPNSRGYSRILGLDVTAPFAMAAILGGKLAFEHADGTIDYLIDTAIS